MSKPTWTDSDLSLGETHRGENCTNGYRYVSSGKSSPLGPGTHDAALILGLLLLFVAAAR